MRRGYFFGTLCTSGLAMMVGCNDGIKIPSSVSTFSEDPRGNLSVKIYRIDEDANFIFESYVNHALLSDFKRGLPKILENVDYNGDGKIGHDEAYEAINVFRPAMKKIFNELERSTTEYALKKKNELNVEEIIQTKPVQAETVLTADKK
jgi:hypothetical protein